jgi:hypothetical protein
MSPACSPCELTYRTSATFPVPASLSDDDDASALGRRKNVCMKSSFALRSAPVNVAVVPAPSIPSGMMHASAYVVASFVRTSRRIGSFGCALSSRNWLSVVSLSRSHTRLRQPKYAFHMWPNATVSIARVTSTPT